LTDVVTARQVEHWLPGDGGVEAPLEALQGCGGRQRRPSPLACVISVGVRPPRKWRVTSSTPPCSTLPLCIEVRGQQGASSKP
jgi:hypothetical protein